MKAILEFDLNESDEEEKYKVYVKAIDLYFCLCDIEQEVRQDLKYENNLTSKKFLEIIQDKLSDYDLNLNMLK